MVLDFMDRRLYSSRNRNAGGAQRSSVQKLPCHWPTAVQVHGRQRLDGLNGPRKNQHLYHPRIFLRTM